MFSDSNHSNSNMRNVLDIEDREKSFSIECITNIWTGHKCLPKDCGPRNDTLQKYSQIAKIAKVNK